MNAILSGVPRDMKPVQISAGRRAWCLELDFPLVLTLTVMLDGQSHRSGLSFFRDGRLGLDRLR